MTTEHPTVEVTYHRWVNDFHGIRPAGEPDERPVKLNAAVGRVAMAIAAHYNVEKGKAWPGYKTIAASAQVSPTTVEKAIPILEAAGWLIVTRGNKRRSKSGAISNDNNVYRLASPVEALRAARKAVDNSESDTGGTPASGVGVPQPVGQGTPVSGVELRSEPRNLTTNFQIRSVGASANRDSSAKTDPTELPADWTPNKFHRSSAASKGLDVDVLAALFRDQMTGERRSDWGSTFGAFINEYAEYRSEETFPSFPAVEDDEPEAIYTGPDPTTQAMDWVTPALWMEGINPDTLTADERATITLAWGDEPAADVARRIRENRDRRHLTVVPNAMVAEVTAQVAAKLGELSEDELDAIDVFVDRHGFGADDLVRYIAAWRNGEPFSLIELEPEEYDPFTGVYNPNPVVTGAQLREALDAIKRVLPGGFRGDEMATAREGVLYGDSWSQVAETLRDGRISA